MKSSLPLAAACLAAIASQPAGAVLVNFDDLATSASYREFQSYTFGGFQFTTTTPCADCLLTWGKTNTSNADYNGATLSSNRGYAIVITRTDGGLFDLSGLSMGNLFNGRFNLTSYEGTFGFTTQSGTTTQNFAFTRYAGMDYYWLNRTNLLSVTISPGVQIDNIGLTNSVIVPAAAGVPEPASWAMMIAGFGLVGGAMRRRETMRRAVAR